MKGSAREILHKGKILGFNQGKLIWFGTGLSWGRAMAGAI